MPELAEVEFYRRQWDPALRAPILRIATHPQARVFRGIDEVEASFHALRGQPLLWSATHGKQMLFRLGPHHWLGLHLGMTGELRLEPPDHAPLRHDHLVLFTKKFALVFADSRLFGRVRLDHTTDDAPPLWWRELPPAPTDDAFTFSHLQSAFRSQRPVKALLLDQALFPGVGNWMADEILWRSSLHPLTPAASLALAEQKKLFQKTRWVSEKALHYIAPAWDDPPASWFYHYRWTAEQSCPQCSTTLIREEAAGRTTCWCPQCQPPLAIPAARTSRLVKTGQRRERPTQTSASSTPKKSRKTAR
jgi:formamidopyrimidine-DNA glycosylase